MSTDQSDDLTPVEIPTDPKARRHDQAIRYIEARTGMVFHDYDSNGRLVFRAACGVRDCAERLMVTAGDEDDKETLAHEVNLVLRELIEQHAREHARAISEQPPASHDLGGES